MTEYQAEQPVKNGPVKFGTKPYQRMAHEVAEAFMADMFEREPEHFAVYYMRAMGVDGLMAVADAYAQLSPAQRRKLGVDQ